MLTLPPFTWKFASPHPCESALAVQIAGSTFQSDEAEYEDSEAPWLFRKRLNQMLPRKDSAVWDQIVSDYRRYDLVLRWDSADGICDAFSLPIPITFPAFGPIVSVFRPWRA